MIRFSFHFLLCSKGSGSLIHTIGYVWNNDNLVSFYCFSLLLLPLSIFKFRFSLCVFIYLFIFCSSQRKSISIFVLVYFPFVYFFLGETYTLCVWHEYRKPVWVKNGRENQWTMRIKSVFNYFNLLLASCSENKNSNVIAAVDLFRFSMRIYLNRCGCFLTFIFRA